jgi:nitrite reductase/ring-hydroxylating ferredoxin subunit
MSSPTNVSRRRALGYATGAGVTVAAGVAGYLVANNSAAAQPGPPSSEYSRPAGGQAGTALAALGAIPDGGGVVLADRKLVLTRSGSTVHCFTAVCTHQQCLVTTVSGGAIHCPCHGSAFDAGTGAVVAGPAPAPLAAVPVTVKDGQVLSS